VFEHESCVQYVLLYIMLETFFDFDISYLYVVIDTQYNASHTKVKLFTIIISGTLSIIDNYRG